MSDLSEQKRQFYRKVLPARPNEWEVDDVFDHLGSLRSDMREVLLSQVEVIWPISHSLCFTYLIEGVAALRLISAELLPEWVRQILGIYEKRGLVGAREFMADVDKLFLGPMRGEAGVGYHEVTSTLLPYIRGVSGLQLNLDTASLPGTDSKTIYVPARVDHFLTQRNNLLLYKIMVTFQWGHIVSRIYREVNEAEDIIADPLREYSDTVLAADLFAVLQFGRVYGFLFAELPGLIRQGRKLCVRLIGEINAEGREVERCNALKSLLLQLIQDCEQLAVDNADGSITRFGPRTVWAENNCLDQLPALYARFSQLSGAYRLGAATMLLGEFDFKRAAETIRLRRQEDKQKFEAMVAAFLATRETKGGDSENYGKNEQSPKIDALTLLMIFSGQKQASRKEQLLIDNEGVRLPAELVSLMKDIVDDMGEIPNAYVQAAAGIAGGGFNYGESRDAREVGPIISDSAYCYDEWDFRRVGYRADWCSLEEKTLSPVRSGFISQTLGKYESQLKRLRHQFEMLRTTDRCVRRQRYGDDIDLDALIEALGDSRAGLPPSDRLFSRLLRNERDITAMFLVDMSNSTEGWVGVALKEALVLLAETLEVVGDRYGIYGFSGMRRSRSELYHIKHIEESYSTVVQQRIAAIMPKEYTRMGPPIRHLTRKLLESPGKVRLLVVISDGKPEDYDDYKGEYAIEDTRKALLEAKGLGIHPFCITIDKSAHEYLRHMFGQGNYIFVNSVKSLPAKMVHMYRLLTS